MEQYPGEQPGLSAHWATRLAAVTAIVVGLVTGVGILAGGGMATAPPKMAPDTTGKLSVASAQLQTAVVIGDSLSTGHGTNQSAAWPNQLMTASQLAGLWNIENAAENGAGYVQVGENGSSFLTEVKNAVKADTQLVIFFGSENDMGQSSGDITAAATDAYALARKQAPKAQLIVVGPPSSSSSPEAERLSVRDAIKTAAEKAGVAFIDPIEQQWLMNDAATLVGPDGIHPSLAGQQYLAEKMVDILASSKSEALTGPMTQLQESAPAGK